MKAIVGFVVSFVISLVVFLLVDLLLFRLQGLSLIFKG